MTALAAAPTQAGPLPLAPGLYPARAWPANILRLHLVFAQAVDPWGVEQPVMLLDGQGRERPGVFVDVPGGLWSACGRILTVLLHPGRVKRGLVARDRLGPALTAGETVALAPSPALRRADGGAHGLPERFVLHIAPAVFAPVPPRAIRRTGDGVLLGGPAPIVRRQNIWRRSRRKLAECGPRLGVGFRRRACGVASADVRWFVA